MLPTGHEMIGVQQRLGCETLDVFVPGRVDDPVAVAPDTYQIRCAQLCEMLRNGRRAGTDMLSELVHRVLTMQQRPHDPQPGGISEQLQDTHRGIDLDVRRLST